MQYLGDLKSTYYRASPGGLNERFSSRGPEPLIVFFHNTLISKFCAETQSGQSMARAFNPVSEHVKKSSAMQGGGFFIFGPQIASAAFFIFQHGNSVMVCLRGMKSSCVRIRQKRHVPSRVNNKERVPPFESRGSLPLSLTNLRILFVEGGRARMGNDKISAFAEKCAYDRK